MASSVVDSSWFKFLKEFIISPMAVIAAGAVAIYLIVARRNTNYPKYDEDDYEAEEETLQRLPLLTQDMTLSELAEYNAKRVDGRFLVGINGRIFDVSNAPEDFGPGGLYEELSGTDMGDFVRKSAEDVGVSFERHLNDWDAQLEAHFPVVGELLNDIDKAEPTSEQAEKEGDTSSGNVEIAKDDIASCSANGSIDKNNDKTLTKTEALKTDDFNKTINDSVISLDETLCSGSYDADCDESPPKISPKINVTL